MFDEILAAQFKELEKFACAEDFGFVMSLDDNLIIDGHFTKKQLLWFANKILEVFSETTNSYTES